MTRTRSSFAAVGALRAAGIRLDPTGRNHRHYTAVLIDLDDGTAALLGCGHQIWVNPYHEDRPNSNEAEMIDELDVIADLNAEDDDGLGWSTLSDARDTGLVRPGAMLLAGNESARAVVRVVAVDDDGQIHFAILPGSVAKNRHLLDRTTA